MHLTCPHCGFSRQVDAARIPEKPLRVTCPRCRRAFPFSREENWQAAATGPATSPPTALAAPAGFWVRAVAGVLDLLAIGMLESVLGSLLIRIGGVEPGIFGPEGRAIMLTVAAFGVVLGYAYRVFFIGYCGQTPGKMAVRVKVIRTDGTQVGYGCALLREVLGKFLSKLLLGIGYLMVAFDSRKQGLHDKIADTFVVQL